MDEAKKSGPKKKQSKLRLSMPEIGRIQTHSKLSLESNCQQQQGDKSTK